MRVIITLYHFILALIVLIGYLTYSILHDEKNLAKRMILLIFCLGFLILLLVYLTFDPLKNRVNRLERKVFRRNWKQTLLSDYFGHDMEEEEDFTLLKK